MWYTILHSGYSESHTFLIPLTLHTPLTGKPADVANRGQCSTYKGQKGKGKNIKKETANPPEQRSLLHDRHKNNTPLFSNCRRA